MGVEIRMGWLVIFSLIGAFSTEIEKAMKMGEGPTGVRAQGRQRTPGGPVGRGPGGAPRARSSAAGGRRGTRGSRTSRTVPSGRIDIANVDQDEGWDIDG